MPDAPQRVSEHSSENATGGGSEYDPWGMEGISYDMNVCGVGEPKQRRREGPNERIPPIGREGQCMTIATNGTTKRSLHPLIYLPQSLTEFQPRWQRWQLTPSRNPGPVKLIDDL